MDTALCTGLGHREDALHIEERLDDGEHRTRPLVAGDEIAIELVGTRRCIGFRAPDSQSLVACPKQEQGIGANQCPDCFNAAMMLPCLRCDGERCANPQRRSSCVQPDNHAVYLASFGPGLLKVGVARWERRRERLVEQGARAALIICRDDGQMVRRVESQIKNTGIPDRLHLHDKIFGLTQATDFEQMIEEVQEAAVGLRPRIMGRWLAEPEVVYLPDLPLLEYPPRVLAPQADLRLRGIIAAVCGQMLVIDSDSGERIALDVGSLVGYQLRQLEEQETGVGQMALAF